MAEEGEIPLDQLADDEDEFESCRPDFTEEPVPDDQLLFVVLSPEGDPARIEEYHRLALGQAG